MPSPPDTTWFYLLLMRHGRDPAGAGNADVSSVGQRLAQTVKEIRAGLPEQRIELHCVLHGPSIDAKETARIVRAALDPALSLSMNSKVEFDSTCASPYSGNKYGQELKGALRQVRQTIHAADHATPRKNGFIVVGHEPLMSTIASKLSGVPAPLSNAEILCVAIRRPILPSSCDIDTWRWRHAWRKWALAWSIAPSDPETEDALRSKVASKMQVAGILGAAVTAALVFLLQNLFEERGNVADLPAQMPVLLRYISALLLLIAAVLYFATLYFCDVLMMPRRFWAEARHRRFWFDARPSADLSNRAKWLVLRPPSSSTWIIYQNMTRVWRVFFMKACYALLLGLVILCISLFKPDSCRDLISLATYFVVGVLALLGYLWLRRPRLGATD